MMVSMKEKLGYGLGDMSSSMFWKIFSFYLPIFYSDVFGLSLSSAAVLLLVTRIWDAVSDPVMGIVADRTRSRWGKYRPWLLWMALPFAVCGCLLFYTPQCSEACRTCWAYVTYILMMTVYTSINVPYGSMLGVMTADSNEKTVFSSYRMFFADVGSFVAVFVWEPLVGFFTDISSSESIVAVQHGWFFAMCCIALTTIVLFLLCFGLTKERVTMKSAGSIVSDVRHLLRNVPWWLLTAAALCTNLFTTLRGSVATYYFKYNVGEGAVVDLGIVSFLFFAGLFLALGEVCNMAGVVLTVPVSSRMGKKATFIAAAMGLAVLSVAFFHVPMSNGGFIMMVLLQVAISVLTGIISPLVWSMYADVAEYSERKNGMSSTALIFSSGSMAQKFGGAVAGAAVMWMLDGFGLVPNAVVQTDTALFGVKMVMSYIPAAVAVVEILILLAYPLGKKNGNGSYA